MWSQTFIGLPGVPPTTSLAGTAAQRPQANYQNTGWFYLATDTNGGTSYRSNGETWVQTGAGVSGGGGSHTLLDGSTHTDTIAQTPSQGSLIYGTGAAKWDELTIGAESATLIVSGGSPLWGTAQVAGGGTGLTSATAYAVLVGGTTSTAPFQSVASVGTSGQPLISAGAGVKPAFGTLGVAGGGTGVTSTTAYAVQCGGTTSTAAHQVAAIGTAGRFLGDNGAGTLPTFQALTAASDTVAGVIEIAVQSEQETGTDTVRAVTPGRQHYHPSAVKGWCQFTGDTTPAALSSPDWNVASLTDTAAGDYTVVWDADFSSTVYGFAGMSQRDTASDNILMTIRGQSGAIGTGATTTGLRVATINTGGTKIDCAFGAVIACGDH